MHLIYAVITLGALASANDDDQNPFKSAKKWIDLVNNNPNSTWTAGLNFDENLPPSHLSKLLGLKKRDGPSILQQGESITDIDDGDIPVEFDSRKKWQFCKALQTIRDQGACGSCWAVSAASTFTDRLCISTKGDFNSQLSALELLSCCESCGFGCNGGDDMSAWQYFKNDGIVTGGDYDSNEGCQPYPLQKCNHTNGILPSCSTLPVKQPLCHESCTNEGYKKPYDQDHHFVNTAYKIKEDVIAIQKDILKYGPVQVSFYVKQDFLSYKHGVYIPHPKSKTVGAHAVKLIGWGVENKIPYWLIQNSWNRYWGDEGLFKILRGSNTCDIESDVLAGIPKVN